MQVKKSFAGRKTKKFHPIIGRAALECNLPAYWTAQAKLVVKRGGALYIDGFNGHIQAFLGFNISTHPYTGEKLMMELMLYVDKEYRGLGHAEALVDMLEQLARAHTCDAVVAGSSLNSNAHAKRLYSGLGFKTNYTFRKELLCAIQ
jgi:ribosomal protein S18 acetylase RimI-like enzyme